MEGQENSEKQIKKNKKKRIQCIAIVISVIVIIVCSIYIIIKLYTENVEKEKYETLAEYMKEEPEENKEGNVEQEKVITERMKKLEELHNQNEDIVAWLEILDTNINYPILQTNNNDYYLNHNYEKKYTERGSIFLDKDVDIKLPSSNFLMYGHRNKGGAMFENLLKYKEKNFYEEHKNIQFTTLEEDSKYEILAVFYSRIYYKSEKNVFRYYFFINAETEEEYNEYVSNAKKASIYDTGVNAEYGEQLITLSTCEYSQEDGRFVVVAKKSK